MPNLTPTPDDFAARIGQVRTAMGGFFPGVGARVRGRPLHEHCSERRWFDLYLFALTGHQFAENEIELLETLWTYTSYPDPRIWNNRVAALAGASRASASLAIGAAIAVSDAHIYGLGPILEAYDFLAIHAYDNDTQLTASLQMARQKRQRLGGYGRPIIAEDERIAPLMARAKALGLADGPHISTAFRIEQALLAQGRSLKMNYGAPVAAFCLDLGFRRDDCAAFVSTLFLAGMPPIWKEAHENPAGGLFPIPVEAIDYDGRLPRRWPE